MSHKELTIKLLNWFRKEGQKYPFRETSDPYKILVCEILLRKTRAEQVAKIYSHFFAKFPTVESLSNAPEEEIAKIIKSLGIIRRAKDLSIIAKKIVDVYDGTIPDKESELISLPGVGSYVANCILLFGYGKNFGSPIDTNVNRVLSRVLGYEKFRSWSPKDEIIQTYSSLAPTRNRRSFHHALIDLAHSICKFKNPECTICPISEFCNYSKGVLYMK